MSGERAPIVVLVGTFDIAAIGALGGTGGTAIATHANGVTMSRLSVASSVPGGQYSPQLQIQMQIRLAGSRLTGVV